jgi:hypothetical protein
VFSKNDAYSNFRKYMDENLGSVFNISYHQNQYNESLVSDGIICFESYKKYIFDNSIIRIIYDNTYIKTINKQNKQIIYDNLIEGEISLFDLLFSKNRLDVLSLVSSDPENSIIKFTLESLDIMGVLNINNISGEPNQLSLFNADSSLMSFVHIKKIEDKDDFILKAIDTSFFELIDLRE